MVNNPPPETLNLENALLEAAQEALQYAKLNSESQAPLITTNKEYLRLMEYLDSRFTGQDYQMKVAIIECLKYNQLIAPSSIPQAGPAG